MNQKYRILFSARDPAAVGHTISLLKAFRNDDRFKVFLAASGAALAMLRQVGEAPREISFLDKRDHVRIGENASPLIKAASDLINEVNPDIVFTSISSFGVGIDEALLATARVPTFAMQDFWGDVNLGLKIPAKTYFVIDDHAEKLTVERWGVRAIAVGSPKHALYERINIPILRQNTRTALGVKDTTKVIGFFGQSPEIPGHEAAFEDFIRALRLMQQNVLLLIREHPKFGVHKESHIALAKRFGLDVVDVTDGPNVEPYLSACDLVVTCFSLCGLDHAYLSAYSSVPLGSALFLLSNEGIRRFALDVCGSIHFPTVKKGMGQIAESPSDILEKIKQALSNEHVRSYFEASKLLHRENPSETIIKTTERVLSI